MNARERNLKENIEISIKVYIKYFKTITFYYENAAVKISKKILSANFNPT